MADYHAFSLRRKEPSPEGNMRAFDFDWTDGQPDPNTVIPPFSWSCSMQEGDDWRTIGPLAEEDALELLEHFHLEAWPKEFPLDRLRLMTPRELVEERKAKEERDPALPMLWRTIQSDTPGADTPAREWMPSCWA